MNWPTNDRDWFMWVVEQYYGHWYTWGGDDPSGFDCSGLVIEGLKSVGMIRRGEDLTADGLWRMCQMHETQRPTRGSFCFWFDVDGRAIHVAVCLDHEKYIGAEGGGRHVKTIEDAIQANAFIKIRPLSSRPGAKYVHIW